MKKVLFFDDEPFIIGYLIKSLQEFYGWNRDKEKEITFVSTVDELLDKMNNDDETYSLFVLDLMVPMPEGEVKKHFNQDELNRMDEGSLTGYVMAEKIRKIDKYKKVPILYLSARTSPPPIDDSEKEYTKYMRKPFSSEKVSEMMDELLNA